MKTILLVLAIGLLMALVFTRFENKNTSSQYAVVEVVIKNVMIQAEIADTVSKQRLGLGGREKLSENSGMLFVYPEKTIPGFWMKGMLIPIDIIWIVDGKILDIDKNVPNHPIGTPDERLPGYSPDGPVDYVLEVNAGFSDKYGFSKGDMVQINY